VTVWDDLKPLLLSLEEAGALTIYPNPRDDADRHPPFSIHLAAWASTYAIDLHNRFRDDVELHVGALRYPDPQPRLWHEGFDQTPVVDPSVALVTLPEPIEVESGHSLQASLRVRCCGTKEMKFSSDGGHLTAVIVDPETETVVGGSTAPVPASLVVFGVPPNEERDVPLLVGTESFLPELGYSIPAGAWRLAAVLRIASDPAVRTPYLPMTVR